MARARERTLREVTTVEPRVESDPRVVALGDVVTLSFDGPVPVDSHLAVVVRLAGDDPLDHPDSHPLVTADSPLFDALLGSTIGQDLKVPTEAGPLRVTLLARVPGTDRA